MKKKRGFSLVELLLVITIVLVLGVLSSVFYSRFLNQNSVANVSDTFASQLRKAQVYAMAGKQNTNWGVKYSIPTNTITLFAVTSSAFDEKNTMNSTIAVGGFSQVIFAKATGLPDSPQVISISGGGNTKTVSINSQGMVAR